MCNDELLEQVIVDYKWKTFARQRHLEQFRRVVWTLLLARFLANPTVFGAVSELPTWEYLVMVILVVFSLSPTLNFCTRLCIVEGWRNLLDVDSAASWVDVGWASAIAWEIAYSIYVRNDLLELEGKRLSSLQSWTLIFLWARVFLFLIPFKMGRFVLIIVEITRQLKYFFGLLAVIILAFADVMFEAQAADRAVDKGTGLAGRAYVDNLFSVCKSRLQARAFIHVLLCNCHDRARLTLCLLVRTDMFGIVGDPGGVVPDATSQNQLTLSIIFILSSLILTTVVLNMLIAIMTNVFDQAEERADARLYLCRARLILEFEAAMSPDELTDSQKNNFFPPYLHVLRPISHEQLQQAFQGDGGLKDLMRHWPHAATRET